MTTVNVRIDEKTKAAAGKALAAMGMDLSTGVKIFLTQVANENSFPFTPTKNPAVIRAKWDKEVADALKNGKVYKAGEDILKDIL
jgi:DNA-damage-inducible protein J